MALFLHNDLTGGDNLSYILNFNMIITIFNLIFKTLYRTSILGVRIAQYRTQSFIFRSIRSLCHETDLLASEIIDQAKSVLAGDADQLDELNQNCLNWKTKVIYHLLKTKILCQKKLNLLDKNCEKLMFFFSSQYYLHLNKVI